MRVAFLNPQGNFDPTDRGWTEHPDFGGQLVYVKEVALALGELGCRVDIVTRKVTDSAWPEFAGDRDAYPGADRVRILRFACGPEHFLPKEDLWSHLRQWKDRIVRFYLGEGGLPDATTGHYADGGLAAALIHDEHGVPNTFTGHSLGAQKMDKFVPAHQDGTHRRRSREDLDRILKRFRFDKRIAAERLSLARAGRVVTSTHQERFDQYGHKLYHGAVDPSQDDKFAVIPPGVNLSVFGHDRRNDSEDRVAERVRGVLAGHIDEGRRHLPVVICSSRLDHKKNHLALVQAFAQSDVLRDTANLLMSIRGSSDALRERDRFRGEQREILDNMATVLDQHDLWGSVATIELENQAELAACYRYLARKHRGVFALTAVYEPFGLAPLEAMAAGLAGLATRNGGPSESLRDDGGEYGVLVDPQDPEDIARGLVRITRSADEWERIRRAGMRRVADRYTWQRTAQGYLRTLGELLQGIDSSDTSYPVPAFFRDVTRDDIGRSWLEDLYFT
jgi:sucrose-phosphate synthase